MTCAKVRLIVRSTARDLLGRGCAVGRFNQASISILKLALVELLILLAMTDCIVVVSAIFGPELGRLLLGENGGRFRTFLLLLRHSQTLLRLHLLALVLVMLLMLLLLQLLLILGEHLLKLLKYLLLSHQLLLLLMLLMVVMTGVMMATCGGRVVPTCWGTIDRL